MYRYEGDEIITVYSMNTILVHKICLYSDKA